MDTKAWYASKTIWGVIISVVGKLVAVVMGYNISEAEAAQATDFVTTIIPLAISGVGDVLAWYGRVKADKAIGKAE
jgi:hypothetical protein